MVTRSTHSDVSDPGRLQYGVKRVRGVDASPLSIEEGVYTRSKKVKVVEAIHTSSSAVEPGTLLSGDEGSTGPTSTNLRVLDAHELSNGLDSEESSVVQDECGDGGCDSESPCAPPTAVPVSVIASNEALLSSESSLDIISPLYSTEMDMTGAVVVHEFAVAVDESQVKVDRDSSLTVTAPDDKYKPKQLNEDHVKYAGVDVRVGQRVTGAEEEPLQPVEGEMNVSQCYEQLSK